MKIFCCSDTHGKAAPKPPNDAAIFLHAGDLYNQLCENRPINNCDEVAMDSWRKNEWHFVSGNHDVYDALGIVRHRDVTGCVSKIADKLFLIGLGWHGGAYYDLPLNLDISSLCDKVLRQCLLKMCNGDHSILLTHYPPILPNTPVGVLCPEEEGFSDPEGYFYDSILDVINACKPKLVVCGHVHGLFGTDITYNGTRVIFPGPQGMTVEI